MFSISLLKYNILKKKSKFTVPPPLPFIFKSIHCIFHLTPPPL